MSKRYPDVECIHYEHGEKIVTYMESPYNKYYEEDAPRSKSKDGPNKGIIIDSMNPVHHPITGKLMDSKSKFREITRANGCVEIGNDRQVDRRHVDNGNMKADIANAIRELEG